MIKTAILKFLPSQHIIDGYGRGGFRFANMSHQGGLLSLPSGVSAWNINTSSLVEADFERVFIEAERIDMFLFGSGVELLPISPYIKQLFKDCKISLDIMPTAAAARTYNILLSEGRRVACGLVAVI
jgi:uncharacterized protein